MQFSPPSGDRVDQGSDRLQGDADLVAALERKRVGRDDPGARHEVGAVREAIRTEEPVGEGGDRTLDAADGGFTVEDGAAADAVDPAELNTRLRRRAIWLAARTEPASTLAECP